MAVSNRRFQRDTFITGMMTSFCTVCRQLVAASFDQEKLRQAEEVHACQKLPLSQDQEPAGNPEVIQSGREK